MVKTYNLFISHSWTYEDHYRRLINLLQKRKYFKFKDYSVPPDDPIHTSGSDRELYEAIKNQMKSCHVVLVLAGVYATYSKWIQKEILIAKKEFAIPKPIIAIVPRGQIKISRKVRENANEIVGWNTESIVRAIRKWANA